MPYRQKDTTDTTVPPAKVLIRGETRLKVQREFAERYAAGETVRQLAASIGGSYGLAYRLLDEAGVRMRARGGARKREYKRGYKRKVKSK
jgi:hypothetical protein